MKQLQRILYCLIIFIVIMAAGCQEKAQTPAGPPAVLEPVVRQWPIRADCIAEFYAPDGSRYITEQVYLLDPGDNMLRIIADEPQGIFEWLLADSEFTVVKGNEQLAAVSSPLCSYELATGLLELFTANIPSGRQHDLNRMLEPVKVEGQWYFRLSPGNNISLLKNKDTGIIEIVELVNADNGQKMALYGYNYEKLDGMSGQIPSKVEVFALQSRYAELTCRLSEPTKAE